MTPQNVDNEAKDECTLDIDNQKLKPTANLRILGVNIDDKLRFTEHISDICKNVSKKIGVLARLRNLISSKTKLQLYLTAILPHLTYIAKLHGIFVSNLRGENWRDCMNAL